MSGAHNDVRSAYLRSWRVSWKCDHFQRACRLPRQHSNDMSCHKKRLHSPAFLYTVLCKLGDLPPHLQFNQHILSGYRPPMSAGECLGSMFYWHNESFNIYSHCLCFIFFLLSFRDYSAVWSQAVGPVATFIVIDFIICTTPFALSVTYHTFMCHHAGARAYKRLLKLDVLGVWFTQTFGAISAIYVSFHCFPMVRWLYLLWYMMVALTVLYYLLIVDCKRKRAMWLTTLYSFLVLAHFVRLSPQASTDLEAFRYFIAMDTMSVVGAAVNALHLPERWLPGKVNYILNGHTLMHIAAFGVLAAGRRGFLIDMAWLNNGATCIPT